MKRDRANDTEGERSRSQPMTRFALALGLLIAAACSRDAPEIRRVVIVSIDTLRADALGSYGNPNDTTPVLDAIARAGVRAADCVAPTPVTLPSHATLLTGLHPLAHGVLVNSHGALSSEVETLAEQLHAAGWSTGAVVASGILRARYGLAQGFDTYRDDLFASYARATSGRSLAEARADEATDAALAWLDARGRDERVFLFLHLIDPHAPYDAPSPFGARFPDDPYFGEVAFADAQVGRLVEALDALDTGSGRGETLLVVTSDHGEHLGAHDLQTHGGYLYDEVLRIPLLLRGPGLEPGHVIETPTTLADVVPTVLDALGLPIDSALHGHSLLGELPAERRILSVSYGLRWFHNWSPIWSWRGASEKLLRTQHPQRFRLDVDPGEQHDLAAEDPAHTLALVDEVDRVARELYSASHAASVVALDDAAREQLEALGYAAISSGETIGDPLDFSRPDPHEMREANAAIGAYLTARVMGDLAAAEPLLDAAQALDPANPLLLEERGLLLVLLKRYSDFLDWYDALDTRTRKLPDIGLRHAIALSGLGRFEQAETALHALRADHPDYGGTSLELARVLSNTGRLDEALTEYDGLIAREPRHDAARFARSRLLMRMGRRDEATDGLEELIRTAPRYAPAYRVLGLLQARQGKTDLALETLDRFIRLDPHSPHRRSVEGVMLQLKLARDS